jgi:hypothetical protein
MTSHDDKSIDDSKEEILGRFNARMRERNKDAEFLKKDYFSMRCSSMVKEVWKNQANLERISFAELITQVMNDYIKAYHRIQDIREINYARHNFPKKYRTKRQRQREEKKKTPEEIQYEKELLKQRREDAIEGVLEFTKIKSGEEGKFYDDPDFYFDENYDDNELWEIIKQELAEQHKNVNDIDEIMLDGFGDTFLKKKKARK